MLVEGLSPAVMPTIDTGAPRAFGDVLSIGGLGNTSTLASALRLLYWYELRPRPTTPASVKPTHAELHELREANPDMAERASEVATTKRARSLVPASALCFVYAMAYRVDAHKAGAWLRLLNDGTEMDAKHPVHQLRERMIANKTSSAKLRQLDVVALAAKSWHQYLTGKRTTNLRWRDGEDFPSFGDTPTRKRGGKA
jgi:hypothetical protein